MKKICWLVALLAAAYAASPDAVAQRPPVIDVHLHAYAEWPRSVPPDNNAARFLRLTDKQIASHHHAEKPRNN